MPAAAFDWTEARIDELLRMWRTGYTTYQMADFFGVSRNTVCGKLHREKIKRGIIESKPKVRKPSPTDKTRKRRNAMLTLPDRAGFVLSKRTVPVVPVPDHGQLASIVDVTGCRWPVSFDEAAPGGHLFCNHATDGKTYCPYHQQENVATYSQTLIRKTIKDAVHAYTRRAA